MIDVSFKKSEKIAEEIEKLYKIAKNTKSSKEFIRAAKRAANAAKTASKDFLVAEYTLSPKEIKETLASVYTDTGAALKITSPVNPLINFKGTKPKKPPFAKAKKAGGNAQKLTLRAFAATMQSGHLGLWEREEGKRRDKDSHGRLKTEGPEKWHIRELFGPSTVGMFRANEKVHEPVQEKAMEVLLDRFWHEIKWSKNK